MGYRYYKYNGDSEVWPKGNPRDLEIYEEYYVEIDGLGNDVEGAGVFNEFYDADGELKKKQAEATRLLFATQETLLADPGTNQKKMAYKKYRDALEEWKKGNKDPLGDTFPKHPFPEEEKEQLKTVSHLFDGPKN